MELYPELLDIEGIVGVRQLLSFIWEGGLAERRSVPECRVLGELGRSFPRIRERHPRIADFVGVALFQGGFPEGSNLQATATCRERFARGQRPADPQRTGTPLAMLGQR